jgi:hypothetical protein
MVIGQSNEIIAKPTKIGNLEVAEYDFPTTMTWEKAQKACADLGSGWRLPTKDELNLLYKNKDEIGGFAVAYYWSSTEGRDNGLAWVQYFGNSIHGNGFQDNGKKYLDFSVCAVRTF